MTLVSQSKGHKSLTPPGIEQPDRRKKGPWNRIFLTCKAICAFAISEVFLDGR